MPPRPNEEGVERERETVSSVAATATPQEKGVRPRRAGERGETATTTTKTKEEEKYMSWDSFSPFFFFFRSGGESFPI